MGEAVRTEDLINSVVQTFSLKEKDPSQQAPLVLAYLGDNIYELVNRTEAVLSHDLTVQKLHRLCSSRANAASQAAYARFLEPLFTEEEHAVFLRGRNATVYTKAKNAGILEYHLATGLEAVIGYLALSGSYGRITELLKTAWENRKQTHEES